MTWWSGAPSDSASSRRLHRIAGLLVAIGVVSSLHYLTAPRFAAWHIVFQRLYYAPIIVGAFWFGARGGLLTALAASLAYLPHIVMAWSVNPLYEASQYVEIVMFHLAGLLVGLLSDRQGRLLERYRRTTETLEKANRDLKESHAQLARADRLSALGEMAAGLAHELRNPLASINGALEILGSGARAGTPQAEFSEIARKEVQRLDGLVTRFLAYARPHPPALRMASLGPLVDRVVALLRPELERQGVSVDFEAGSDMQETWIDPEQIEQVLLNVLLNAIQASPRGTAIHVGLSRTAVEFRIEVLDRGPGIEAEHVERAFDPFFTTKPGGTGLGLAVSARIVAAHGGTIDARRNDGGGTCVSIRLPAAAAARHNPPVADP